VLQLVPIMAEPSESSTRYANTPRWRSAQRVAITCWHTIPSATLGRNFQSGARRVFGRTETLVRWLLGHPDSAAAEADQTLNAARESGHTGTLMYSLFWMSPLNLLLRNYATASARGQELLVLAEQKAASFLIAGATTFQGCILAAAGEAADAVQMITAGLTALQTTGTTFWRPLYVSYLAKAYAELGKFADARRCVDEAATAVRTTKETTFEAEVHRIAGEIEIMSPERDAAKAEMYFDRALAVARKQQAKSLELRAAKSMARLWRDQGKSQQARELLAPVYGWFTEGFGTLHLKEAKALLEELAA
jgi:predicted ATPase